MAEKTTVRMLLEHAAGRGWHLGNFDIAAAYLHENRTLAHTVFIGEQPRFDGHRIHPHHTGVLRKNRCGTPPVAHTYDKELEHRLHKHGYTQSHCDPCLFAKTDNGQSIVVAVSIDDFLPTSPSRRPTDNLFQTLAREYTVEDLGQPMTYLKWHIKPK